MTMAKSPKSRAAAVCDTGCVRAHNEDAIYCGDDLWLIADGMGGHARGEVASRLAIEAVVQNFSANGDLLYAIEQAQKQIRSACEFSVDSRFMGTTIVALCCRGLSYEIAWVGDSRAYLWDVENQTLSQLTQDHSLVSDMVTKGLLTDEQAMSHPKRHVLTRCLGSHRLGNTDIGHIQRIWQPQQQILLCSDGLSDALSAAQLALVFTAQKDKPSLLQTMLDLVKTAGGDDNISAILIDAIA